MQALSHRIVFLVGDTAPDRAADAARKLSAALRHSGLITSITSQTDPAALKRMGAAYFPYRAGLLSGADRAALASGNGQNLVARALSVLYGPTGMGVLYGKKDILDAMPPYRGGGEMIKEVTFAKTTYNEIVPRFQDARRFRGVRELQCSAPLAYTILSSEPG